MNVHIEACYLYPIKSGAGLRVDALSFDADGWLIGDRDWVVVDAQGRMRWLGDLPELLRLKPVLHQDGLLLSDGKGLALPLPKAADCQRSEILCWNPEAGACISLPGADAGNQISAFASALVGMPIRLVHVESRAHRPNPAHLVSGASLQELLGECPETQQLRFRPNIVIGFAASQAVPFVEEQALALEVHGASDGLALDLYAPCERCIAINTDPADGQTDPRYLAAVTQATGQRQPLGGSRFGVYARAKRAGRLASGAQASLRLNF